MRGREIGRRALRALTTAVAVTAIVLGSTVGLNDWADGVATHATPGAHSQFSNAA
jgi:hypothetical protein